MNVLVIDGDGVLIVWVVVVVDIKIWSCGESNPRPLECKSSALPTELQPQSISLKTALLIIHY